MELNAKLNREKEENKNINKKNNKESDAKNKILILGILILIGLCFISTYTKTIIYNINRSMYINFNYNIPNYNRKQNINS